jgi:hypothetical protein
MRGYFRQITPKPLEPYWHDSEDKKLFIAAAKTDGWAREYVVKYDKAGSYVRAQFAKPKERLALEFLPMRQLNKMEITKRSLREAALSKQGWEVVYIQPTSTGSLLVVGAHLKSAIVDLLRRVYGARIEVI